MGWGHGRRGLRPGQLPARYWRLRYADDRAERLAELEPEQDWYDRDDDSWAPDPRQAALDHALASLYARIGAAAPFNVLPLGPRPPVCPVPARDDGPIEARLVAHVERVTTQPLDAWLDERASAGLLELQAIADEHFAGELWRARTLALFWPFWLRAPSSWRPRGKPELASLLEHLLLAYPAPPFLYAAASALESLAELRWMAYLIALGQGGSLRRLSELANRRWPEEWAVIPHKLVAWLGRVDQTLRPDHALMAAEVLRLGGSDVEARHLIGSGSFSLDPSATPAQPSERDFWCATVGWLVRWRDELDDSDAYTILGWARHMQTERERVGDRFSWRGRTAASALREATAYYQSWSHRSPYYAWGPHGWNWQTRVGELDWEVCELINSAQLREESLAMSHCVRSYDHACWRGGTAIFSLRQGGRRRVTIELQLPSKRVVQAKRAYNQEPSTLEWSLIERWRASVVEDAHATADGEPNGPNSASILPSTARSIGLAR